MRQHQGPSGRALFNVRVIAAGGRAVIPIRLLLRLFDVDHGRGVSPRIVVARIRVVPGIAESTKSEDCSAVEMPMRKAVPMTKTMLVRCAMFVASTSDMRRTMRVGSAMHMSCLVSVCFAMPSTMTVTPTSVQRAVCARERDYYQRGRESFHRLMLLLQKPSR